MVQRSGLTSGTIVRWRQGLSQYFAIVSRVRRRSRGRAWRLEVRVLSADGQRLWPTTVLLEQMEWGPDITAAYVAQRMGIHTD